MHIAKSMHNILTLCAQDVLNKKIIGLKHVTFESKIMCFVQDY